MSMASHRVLVSILAREARYRGLEASTRRRAVDATGSASIADRHTGKTQTGCLTPKVRLYCRSLDCRPQASSVILSL